MSNAIFGIVADRQQCTRVVADLKAAGFRKEDLSILHPDPAPEDAPSGVGTGGSFLVSVHTISPDQELRANDVFQRNGATAITSILEAPAPAGRGGGPGPARLATRST